MEILLILSSIAANMTDESLGDPIDRLAAVNERRMEKRGMKCLEHTYQTFLQNLTRITWPSGRPDRQWT